MKTHVSKNHNQPWIVDQLLEDFRVEDVWQLPIELNAQSTIVEVQNTFVEAIGHIGKKGVAGLLFSFRNWLGKIFKWEDDFDAEQSPKPGLLKTRYAKQINKSVDQLPGGGFQNFSQVYVSNEESLLEIENKTVQAAIHFGIINETQHTSARMTIYVKPNGLFGKLYMLAIKPFRHWIVYPTLLKALAKHWQHKYA